MNLYYGGAEIPGWRTLLAEQGVEHVALSYWGLRRRTKFVRPWLIADKFPADQKIFLDSGAYSVNREDETDKHTVGELKDINAHYMAFADANLDRLEMVSEFDALVLGLDWIKAMREDFWDDLPDGKFMPIWHEQWGMEELDQLAQKYDRVGIPQTSLDGRNLAPLLNSMVQKYGVKLHGVAMTKPDIMAAVRWDSVASTSWISPSQYGDTIVWTGKELKRYPKKQKDQARKRHRTLFTANGFDAEAIEADEGNEILRLSIWSWQQQVADLAKHRGVTTSPQTADEPNAETGTSLVGTTGTELRKAVTTRLRSDDERQILPVMALAKQKEGRENPTTGTVDEVEVDHVRVRSQSMRVCDSCFLASKCPAFESGSNCAYDIPITIQTREQLRSLQNALIEMQSQRVMFMQMAEDMEGGYADPNLSNELDRLQKLITKKVELEQDGFSLTVKAQGRGSAQAGMLTRLFGSEAANVANALPATSADEIIGEILDDKTGVTT